MHRKTEGFTLIECTVAIGVLDVGGVLAASAVKLNGSTEKALTSQTQLRGIHQALVTYAQSNKRGGHDGYFSGFGPDGRVIDASVEGRLQPLLEDNYFTGDYFISPIENLNPWEHNGGRRVAATRITTDQHSYAMLKVDESKPRQREWSETLNTNAIVLSDRNTAGVDQPSSVWTEGQERDGWVGGITRNDNSTTFESDPVIEHTKYGNAPSNETDHLFKADTQDGRDTLMTFHRDAAGQELPIPRRTTQPAE